MSWRTGVGIFADIWPIIKEGIREDEQRKQFTKDLISLFEDYDIDIFDLEGIDEELDEILF